MYLFDLTGKVAIVTGGAEGLGQEFVSTLAEQGCDVAIFDMKTEVARATAAEISQSTGKKVIAVKCDVTSETDVINAVATVVKEFGKIDILVNNAGRLIVALAEVHTLEQWKSVIDVDLTGPWLVGREVFKQSMKERRSGRIINISSVAGILVGGGAPSYNAAKAGVIALTKAQAVEFGPYNILANSIAPGTISNGGMAARSETASDPKSHSEGRNPLKRPGRRGELSGALIYFASDESSYTNAQTLVIDGGLSATL